MRPSRQDDFALEELTALHGLYRLLARLWLREPDAELLALLKRPDVREAFALAGGDLPEEIEEATIDPLALDFCRLWIGPQGHLPPFQSVWETGQFGSQAIASMQSFAGLTGYQPLPCFSSTMLDHLGIQLDWMRHLLEQQLAESCWSPGGPSLQEIRRTFFAAHLNWPDELLSAAAEKADTDFFRKLIRLTKRFLVQERDSLA